MSGAPVGAPDTLNPERTPEEGLGPPAREELYETNCRGEEDYYSPAVYSLAGPGGGLVVPEVRPRPAGHGGGSREHTSPEWSTQTREGRVARRVGTTGLPIGRG